MAPDSPLPPLTLPPEQMRRLVPGPEGIRVIALGGVVGAHAAPAWTELSGG